MTVTQPWAAATETVALLGAGGTMGFPIARNLQRHLPDQRSESVTSNDKQKGAPPA